MKTVVRAALICLLSLSHTLPPHSQIKTGGLVSILNLLGCIGKVTNGR